MSSFYNYEQEKFSWLFRFSWLTSLAWLKTSVTLFEIHVDLQSGLFNARLILLWLSYSQSSCCKMGGKSRMVPPQVSTVQFTCTHTCRASLSSVYLSLKIRSSTHTHMYTNIEYKDGFLKNCPLTPLLSFTFPLDFTGPSLHFLSPSLITGESVYLFSFSSVAPATPSTAEWIHKALIYASSVNAL